MNALEPTNEQLRSQIATLEADLRAANARIAELAEEVREVYERNARLSDTLRATANALKGEPDARMAHSWHDLPEWAAKARAVAMRGMFTMFPFEPGQESRGDEHIVKLIRAVDDWRALIGRYVADAATAMTKLDEQADDSRS